MQVRVVVTDAELRIVEALAKKAPCLFSVGQWLLERLYANGLSRMESYEQKIKTENHNGAIVLVIDDHDSFTTSGKGGSE